MIYCIMIFLISENPGEIDENFDSGRLLTFDGLNSCGCIQIA